MRRPPKFVNGYIDRHGKPRFYFRRAGFKRVPLPGLPWSPEFMAAYELALVGQPVPIGSARTRPDTMRALAISYYNSLAFRSMKANTQSVYRYILIASAAYLTGTGKNTATSLPPIYAASTSSS
jgi:hypothetical protein